MKILNLNDQKTVHGASITLFGQVFIVPNPGSIPQDKFEAIELSIQNIEDGVWSENYANVYLCATNSMPYIEQYFMNFIWCGFNYLLSED